MLLGPIQPPEAVQLDAFVERQFNVTACPLSICVWLADSETETLFVDPLPAGEFAGELAEPDAAPGALVELAGAAELPELPPPPQAASAIRMTRK